MSHVGAFRTFAPVAVLTCALVACTSSPEPTAGAGLLKEGCPVQGQATARAIGVPDARFEGPDAVGGLGDYLLMNEQAAFIISGPQREITYYHYGGIVVDAVTLDGCVQKTEDKLEEIGLVLGKLDVDEFAQSVLRAFRGDRATVINDGADGKPAVVRVSGTDAPYWLVEYTLISSAADGSRLLSEPFGLEIDIDYSLAAGSSVLGIEMTLRSTSNTRRGLLTAALTLFGDSLGVRRWNKGDLGFGGFTLQTGIPWVSAADGEAAYAFGVPDGELAATNIAGVNVFLDLEQAVVTPLLLEKPGDTAVSRFLLAAGDTDSNSATKHLRAADDEPLDGLVYGHAPFVGMVVDDATGAPIAEATVEIEARGAGSEWQVLDAVITGSDGRFSGVLPDFAVGATPGWAFRVFATAAGRDPSDRVEITVPVEQAIEIRAPAAGALAYTIVDGDGAPSPARFQLTALDNSSTRHFLYDTGVLPIPPGPYQLVATRGFEFQPVTKMVSVPASGQASVQIELVRTIDTTGFLSADTHVHNAPSADSVVDQELRIFNAAAHGLEVVVATEHEIIASLEPAVAATGLGHLVAPVTGEEVTAVVPEHMTMFPVQPDGTPRGGPVKWYQLDIDQLIAAQRQRGASVVLINHPGYLNMIQWDRVAASPGPVDPTHLGLAPDAKLWSWALDGMELMNGFGNIFFDGNRRFDNWQSFLNQGRRVSAVASSDAHGTNDVGYPRTYFVSSSDEPAGFSQAEMNRAYIDGRLVLSGGAFARVAINDSGTTVGDLVTDTDGVVALSVHVEALPEIDVSHFLVLANCNEVAVVVAPTPDAVVKYDGMVDVDLTADAHITLVGFGRSRLPKGMPSFNPARGARFITNPIWVDVDGNGKFDPPGGRACDYDLRHPADR